MQKNPVDKKPARRMAPAPGKSYPVTMNPRRAPSTRRRELDLDATEVVIPGLLEVPHGAIGLVVFAHGSGSSRHSTRNRRTAETLHARRLATLRFDLLTEAEQTSEARFAPLHSNLPLLTSRLRLATVQACADPAVADLPVGYFGAGVGAAAALKASMDPKGLVRAVVSRGGYLDLVAGILPQVKVPTLLIVGGNDAAVLALNRTALALLLRAVKRLEIVPGTGHLFEAPGALDTVARLAGDWFAARLPESAAKKSP